MAVGNAQWTKNDDERLRNAAEAGMSCSVIADRVFEGRRTRNAIIGRLHRLDINKPKPNISAPPRPSGRKPTLSDTSPLADIAPAAAVAGLFQAPIEIVEQKAPRAPARKLGAEPKKARPKIECPAAPPTPLNVSLLDISPGQCRFATTTVGRSHLFCGAPTAPTEDVSARWCAWHHHVVFAGTTAAQAMKRER